MKLAPPYLIGLLQAVGLTAYVAGVAWLIQAGGQLFGPVAQLYGLALTLLLFIVSALVCGLIALGFPLWLFFAQNERRRAIAVILWTASWLAALFVFGLTLTAAQH